MGPFGGGWVKGFYRQSKKIKGGVAKVKSSASTKRSKSKQQQCIQDDSCHGEDHHKAEEELRRLDVDMRYGPCIGVTRLRAGGAPADYSSSSSNKSQPKNSTESSRSSSSTSLQLECIWAGKI